MNIRCEVIGDCILYCGDCLEVLPTLEAGSVDAVITDPPYSDVTHEGARTSIDEQLIEFSSFTPELLRRALQEAGRACQRWVVATVDWRHCLPLEENPPAGLRFVRFGVWVKPNGAPQFTGDRPGTGWEAICILHRAGVKMRWNGGGNRAVFIENKINGPHPTCKPIRLITQFVELFSDRGATVLDPFMGSGTTGVACVRTGRKFIGIEKDPEYFEIACERIREAVATPTLFDVPATREEPRQDSLFGDAA